MEKKVQESKKWKFTSQYCSEISRELELVKKICSLEASSVLMLSFSISALIQSEDGFNIDTFSITQIAFELHIYFELWLAY